MGGHDRHRLGTRRPGARRGRRRGQALAANGCDLLQVTAGQTTATTRPDYGRFHLVGWSDLVRNSAAVPTMVGGGLTTADQVNTVLAAGRADLCLLDPRAYQAWG